MEISPAIHATICRLQLPLFSQIHNFPFSFKNSAPHFPRKWRHQQQLLSTPRSLSDDTTSSWNVATEPDDASAPVDSDSSFAMKKKATYVTSDLKGTSIFLVGMNCNMKNKVGQALAESLRYYYFDSDSVVEEASSKDSSGKSFKERDELGFRESETEVLKQLSSMGRLVVNAGNGAVQSATNLALLRHGISIWIDVPLDMIAKEFIGDSAMSDISTPDSFSEALARLTQLYEEHRGGYSTADVTLSLQRVASKCAYDELDHVTAEDMAMEALAEMEKLTRVKKMMEQAGRPF